MTSVVIAVTLPAGALLEAYRNCGHYTDCFSIDIRSPVPHALYVESFYTTRLFRLERFVLKWFLSRPSTDEQAGQLARGEADRFAAWQVEARAPDQLLLTDYMGRTRSWLMVESGGQHGVDSTRLYFGSAVVTEGDSLFDKRLFRLAFDGLTVFHKAYSVALLYSAKWKLERYS